MWRREEYVITTVSEATGKEINIQYGVGKCSNSFGGFQEEAQQSDET